jgi:hypothetical protein
MKEDSAMTDTLTTTETAVAELDSQPGLPGLPAKDLVAPPHFSAAYQAGTELRAMAERLIEKHGATFSHLTPLKVDYLWRRKGGKRRGKPNISDCGRPGGLLAYYSQADFVIWIAANHVRELGLSPLQVEARLFRELLRCGVDADTQEPIVYPFDFEGFTRELQNYGPYSADLYRLVETAHVVQLDSPPAEWEAEDGE